MQKPWAEPGPPLRQRKIYMVVGKIKIHHYVLLLMIFHYATTGRNTVVQQHCHLQQTFIGNFFPCCLNRLHHFLWEEVTDGDLNAAVTWLQYSTSSTRWRQEILAKRGSTHHLTPQLNGITKLRETNNSLYCFLYRIHPKPCTLSNMMHRIAVGNDLELKLLVLIVTHQLCRKIWLRADCPILAAKLIFFFFFGCCLGHEGH